MSDSYKAIYDAHDIWPKLAIMLHWKFITGLGWVTVEAMEWFDVIMNNDKHIHVSAFSDSGGGVQDSTSFTIQRMDTSGWPVKTLDVRPPFYASGAGYGWPVKTLDVRPPLYASGAGCAKAKNIFEQQESAIDYIKTYSGLKRGSLLEHIHSLGYPKEIKVDDWFDQFKIQRTTPFTLSEISEFTSCVMSITLTGEYLENEILNEKFPEYGTVALKALMFNDYELWKKGALFAIISMVREYQTAC